MLKSSSWDFGDAYILVRGTITVLGARADDAERVTDTSNKQVVFKNCGL